MWTIARSSSWLTGVDNIMLGSQRGYWPTDVALNKLTACLEVPTLQWGHLSNITIVEVGRNTEMRFTDCYISHEYA